MFIWRTYGTRSLAVIFRQIVDARQEKRGTAESGTGDGRIVARLETKGGNAAR